MRILFEQDRLKHIACVGFLFLSGHSVIDGGLQDPSESERRFRIVPGIFRKKGYLLAEEVFQLSTEAINISAASVNDVDSPVIVDNGQQNMLDRQIFVIFFSLHP